MTDEIPAAGGTPAAAALAAYGLQPLPEEVALFEMMYGLLRSRADVIHTVDVGELR
jgi:hypothetical protein